jgi:hypothetical protein
MTDNAQDLPTFSDALWQNVELARKNRRSFKTNLKKMERQGLIDLYWEYEEAAGHLKMEPYTDFMDEEASDDTIDDIALWVVAQGKDRYNEILSNPEQTPKTLRRTSSVAADIVQEYRDRYNEPIPFPEEA